MYKELLIQCEKLGIDIEKGYVAYICDQTIGRNDKDYDTVCEETYKQFIDDLENEKEIRV